MTGIGSTPRRPVVAEDIRDLQLRTQHCRAWLGRRLIFLVAPLPGFPGPLLDARQLVERALDGGDHAGGDVGIARRGVWLGVTQQRLDGSDMDLAFEQMGGEAVAQRMQRHALLDPRSVSRCMEQAVEMWSAPQK